MFCTAKEVLMDRVPDIEIAVGYLSLIYVVYILIQFSMPTYYIYGPPK